MFALVAPALADIPTVLKDQRDKASYSIGVDIGSSMKANALDLNTEALKTGLQDGISGAKPQLSDKERAETLMAFEPKRLHSALGYVSPGHPVHRIFSLRRNLLHMP